ncbi:hypothetical protein TTHERM_00289010 (macronuclear) [Tetrahymena thermophila SB210]|uniref:Uncharacterized protein n=1 Tax=Tetrahymena thermophila (strain SB210) TaxID=312017 RepID=I7M229_TETTS|nr:hypothetical protein TTHERM_00289010 [Tetrahymena thermophila SB210]EAR98373.1 hypothetical protein TTHERM_00289010 [Tetrahymena thermophila SB210]|eukprot:XP_001018618.1 hypothetical protein TTHERM_00289010 [Tetrahymena thermophila SB210]
MGQSNSNEILNNHFSLNQQSQSSNIIMDSESLIEESRKLVIKINETFEKISSSRQQVFHALGISQVGFGRKYKQLWSIDDDLSIFKQQLQNLDIIVPLENILSINQYCFELSMIKIGIVSQLCQINRLMDQIQAHLKQNKPEKNKKIQLKNSIKVLNSNIVRLEELLSNRFVCQLNNQDFLNCVHSIQFKNSLKKIDDNISLRNQSPQTIIDNTDLSILSTNQSFDDIFLEQII